MKSRLMKALWGAFLVSGFVFSQAAVANRFDQRRGEHWVNARVLDGLLDLEVSQGRPDFLNLYQDFLRQARDLNFADFFIEISAEKKDFRMVDGREPFMPYRIVFGFIGVLERPHLVVDFDIHEKVTDVRLVRERGYYAASYLKAGLSHAFRHRMDATTLQYLVRVLSNEAGWNLFKLNLFIALGQGNPHLLKVLDFKSDYQRGELVSEVRLAEPLNFYIQTFHSPFALAFDTQGHLISTSVPACRSAFADFSVRVKP